MKTSVMDYKIYCEIKWELHCPIPKKELSWEELRDLYECKLAYLEKVRVRCFERMNSRSEDFNLQDYQHILQAIQLTKEHLASLVRLAIMESLVAL